MKKNKMKNHEEDETDLTEEEMEIESVTTPKDESKTSDLEKKIQALEEQLQKEKSEQLYLRAEFDTFRRRAIKERSDILKYGGERAFVELLNVIDNFERALETKITPDNFESFKNGVQLIAEELKNVFKRIGIEEVPAKNFDPHVFEAISSEESKDHKPGDIVRVFRKAYKFHDKIIRPGQVVIAKAPSESDDSES
jgi:molecular chaperone GrpE